MSRSAGGSAAATVALCALIAIASPAEPAAAAQGGSTVSGAASVTVAVVDGDGAPMAGIPVALRVHDGGQEIGTYEGRSSSEGLARWDDVPAGAGVHARATATFEGADFSSEITTIGPGASPTLEVAVYPIISEGNPIHTEMLHLIVHASAPGVFEVAQVMRVLNLGDAAWLGPASAGASTPAGLVIPVPAAARNVAPIPPPEGGLDPAFVEVHEDHVLDLRPMPPGTRQVAITYELLSDGDGVDVELSPGYPTQAVSLLVGGPEADAVEVSVDGMEPQPAESIGDQTFSSWSAEALGPEDVISFTLGKPGGPTLSPAAWGVISVVVGLLLPIVASLLPGAAAAHVDHLADDLIREIARLDVLHAERAIADDEYVTRRGRALEALGTLDVPDGPAPERG